jgi:hypothetical protein
MIRAFNVPVTIVCGETSEFSTKKVLPYEMRLCSIKTTFRREEAYLYLTVSNPSICEMLDVSVLGNIRFYNLIREETEITISGLYTGRYLRDMCNGYPTTLSIAFIGDVDT